MNKSCLKKKTKQLCKLWLTRHIIGACSLSPESNHNDSCARARSTRGLQGCQNIRIPWRSSLTSLDLNLLLIFSWSLPAFIYFFITSANTNSLKQQFNGCFRSLLYFFHLQQDAWLGLYFCLIDSAFVPSHAEWKTEKTWPSGWSSHPAHHLNAAGEGSESKTCKQAPAK